MKKKQIDIYELIYIAISIATAKHSAWSYSTVMEGPEPVIDWANLTLNLSAAYDFGRLTIWFLSGLLAAVVVDIGMFVVAKRIRESEKENLLGLYLAYSIIVIFSAYFQIMYALQNASAFVPVEGVPEWLNLAFVWRFFIVPMSLPVMSLVYTMFVRIDRALNAPKLGTVDAETGEKHYNLNEAAAYTGYSVSSIRNKAYVTKTLPMYDDHNGNKYFLASDLEKIRRTK